MAYPLQHFFYIEINSEMKGPLEANTNHQTEKADSCFTESVHKQ